MGPVTMWLGIGGLILVLVGLKHLCRIRWRQSKDEEAEALYKDRFSPEFRDGWRE